MLRVAVTGSSGKIGRSAVEALKAAGHHVASFDLKPSPDGGRTTIVDFTDYGQTVAALDNMDTIPGGYDAVVHLAGIPSPGLAPDPHIFQANTTSTYNVFQACRRLGVHRIVWASSETLLGLPFYQNPPPFAPLDETISKPEWSYSLAKHLGEVMADTFVRWAPQASISSLRFSNVYRPDEYGQAAAVRANPETRTGNLWSYVDARDCGEACRLAVEKAPAGHEAFIIAAADTLMDVPSAELMTRYFADVPLREVKGFSSLLSIAKGGRVLGYEPRHSWRDAG
jgi:nucleoside-diphosphate-sugar epimerase